MGAQKVKSSCRITPRAFTEPLTIDRRLLSSGDVFFVGRRGHFLVYRNPHILQQTYFLNPSAQDRQDPKELFPSGPPDVGHFPPERGRRQLPALPPRACLAHCGLFPGRDLFRTTLRKPCHLRPPAHPRMVEHRINTRGADRVGTHSRRTRQNWRRDESDSKQNTNSRRIKTHLDLHFFNWNAQSEHQRRLISGPGKSGFTSRERRLKRTN